MQIPGIGTILKVAGLGIGGSLIFDKFMDWMKNKKAEQPPPPPSSQFGMPVDPTKQK